MLKTKEANAFPQASSFLFPLYSPRFGFNRVFSRDVTVTIFLFLTYPPRIELYYYANVFFCFGAKTRLLRRLERVFRCYSVCETMKDTKKGYFIVLANYKYLCNSIVG